MPSREDGDIIDTSSPLAIFKNGLPEYPKPIEVPRISLIASDQVLEFVFIWAFHSGLQGDYDEVSVQKSK
jgi:hypothetical protein